MKTRYLLSVVLISLHCLPTRAASPRSETRIVSVTGGVGGLLRENSFAEVKVLAQHEGAETLKARLVVACRAKRDGSVIATIERDVELPPHSRKRFELPLSVEDDLDALDVGLWVGRQRVARRVVEPSVLDSDTETLIVVGEDTLGFDTEKKGFALWRGGSPRYRTTPDVLRVGFVSDWSSLPSRAMGYECVDTLLLLGAPPRTFDLDQQRALKQWLRDGGTLIVCASGSLSALRQSFLAEWLPVTLTEQTAPSASLRTSLSGLRPLALLVDNPPAPDEKMLLAVSRPRKAANVIAGSAELPWVVKGRARYFGEVVFLSFDPLREPFRSWQGRMEFWRSLLRWCRGSGSGPNFTGVSPNELNVLIREAKVVDVPSRYVFLAPIVGYALVALVATLYVIRFARRKEMTWLVLSGIVLVFTVGYYVVLRRAVKGQRYLAGITTRTLLPDDPIEYQNAGATFFTPTQQPVEVATHAPDVRLAESMRSEYANLGSHSWRLEADALHLRAVYPNAWSVTGFIAYREAPRRGGIVARLQQEEKTFHYYLTNHTPYTLRGGHVIVLLPEGHHGPSSVMARSVPTLPPNGSARVVLSPTAGERWQTGRVSLDDLPRPRTKEQAQRRLRRWLTLKALENGLINGGRYARRDYRTMEGHGLEPNYGAAFIAFTDRPPFPLTVRGFRQDWYHLVIAPLPGLHPDLASRDEPSETSSTDLDSADLLSASAKLEEDTEENTTNVYGGEAVLECSMGYSESKRKRRVFVSLSAKPRGKARLECAFYNWRTGQWSMWQPKFDKDGEAYHSLDLDHIHPALFIAHVKLTVRSADVRSFVRIRNFSVEVKPVEEEEE